MPLLPTLCVCKNVECCSCSPDARSSVSEESDDIQGNDTTVESDEFENDNQNNDITGKKNG